MKAFFEEYGFVLVAVIVVMLLVGMSTSVSGKVEEKITGIVDAIGFEVNEDATGGHIVYEPGE